MKKVLLSSVCLFLSVLFSTTLLNAQTAINPFVWTGSAASTTIATDSSTFNTTQPALITPGAASIFVSQWHRSSAMAGTAAGACYNTSNWEIGGSLATAQTNNKYIYFTVSTNSTTEVVVRNVVLQSQVSATGPSSCQLTYNMGAGDINYGATATGYATTSAITIAFSPATPLHICAGKTVTFKLYGWGATTAAGTLRINDNTGMNDSFNTAVAVVASITPNTVCAGTNVVFTGGRSGGSGVYSYSWSGPGTLFTTTSRNPQIFGAPTTASGIYTFTATDTWGCSATDTTMLTVNPAPPTPVATPTGTVTICSYDSVVLTAPTGYTYQWRTGSYAGGAAIAGATNITYTARTSNTYRVEVTNSFGCTTRGTPPTTVVVDPSASGTVTTSGSLSFCTGGSVTLTGATGAGYTYQWYNGATAIAGATNVAYTATASGSYSLKITVPTGCVTTSATYNVVEVALPTIFTTDTTAFCEGGSATLRVNISSAATGVLFQWKKNSVNIPGATNTTYIATSTGIYTCFVNIPGSCTITTNQIVLNVHPLPAPVITFNHATNLFSTFSYYTHYQWYLNTITIAGATNRTTTGYVNGSYRVMVTDTFGCVRLSDPYGLYNLAVGNVGEAAAISVYPNPATDIVHIETAAEVSATVTGIEGKVVIANTTSKDINISSLADGLYILTVYDTKGNRLLVEKLIKR